MIKRQIGTAPVHQGKAECIWEIDENSSPGEKKIYVAYMGSDGYMLAETWENVSIKIPTTTTMSSEEIYTNPTVNPNQPVTVQLSAIVNDMRTLDAVINGKVQFQIKTELDDIFINIGNPVNVIGGVATYTYTVPQTPQTTILVKAIYLGSGDYGGSECSTPSNLVVRGTVDLSIKPLRVNHGETKTITTTVKTFEGNDVDGGSLNIYLDNNLIKSISSVVSQKIEFDYVFPQNINSGEHLLKAEYVGTDNYSGGYATSVVYVRSRTLIDNSPVYATQTLVENGEVVQGIAVIPINVLDENSNIVPEGVVTFTCGGSVESVEFGVNSNREITYNIPIGMQGGDELPFTLSYQENLNYQACEVQSSIIIKYRTNVELEDVEGELGDTVTLVANVTDENNNNVDEGEVEFSVESTDDDNE